MLSELVHQTLGGLLHQQTERFPDNDALVSDNARYTYSGLLEASGDLARRLLSAGVKRGTHVGVWSNDTPEMIVLLFAVWRLGAVAIPMCTNYGPSELRYIIDMGGIEYIVIDSGYRELSFPELCRNLARPAQDRIFAMNHVENSGYLRLCDLPDAGAEALAAAEKQVECTDSDTILFTSGSTGKFKPVETSHFARVNTVIAQANAVEATEADRFCSVLPLYHCFSISAVVLAAIASGASACFPASRGTRDILSFIEKHRCTVLTAVPTLFSALLKRQGEMKADLSSLRTGIIGGSSYPPALFKRICEELGYDLLPSLGQTEATAGVTAGSLSDSLEVRSTTLGVPFPGVEMRIDTKNGEPQGKDNPGEICIRGFNVMKGYFRQEDATAQVIDPEGWLHTGDMGWMDEEGRLHYSGRIKEIIIRGGDNIFPGELERVILDDHRISECRAIGVPDPHYIEEICVCVVVKPGQNVTEDDIRQLVANRLSHSKIPRYVLFFDALPRTATGKTDNMTLKAEANRLLGLDLKTQ